MTIAFMKNLRAERLSEFLLTSSQKIIFVFRLLSKNMHIQIKQLLDDLKEVTIYKNLKDEAFDSTLENSLCKRLRTWRNPDT